MNGAVHYAEHDQIEVLSRKLAANAPVTMRLMKESIRRIQTAGIPDGEDLIRECYGSRDFGHGVECFLAKRSRFGQAPDFGACDFPIISIARGGLLAG